MCTHPLKAFQVGINSSGKPQYKITSYNTHHVELLNNALVACSEPYRGAFAEQAYYDWIEIPCGKCIECRLKFSREWADRMMLEAQEYTDNYFLTLTYDNEHVRVAPSGFLTLYKKDFQDFMKRLRKHYEPTTIRFYAAGEYGDHTFRPHYHAILFNCPISDLESFGFSGDYPVYISKTITKLWKHGHVMIAPVSWDTCAYTARYVVKKQKGRTAEYYKNEFGILPEFSLMSRRPGIGRKFFDENYKDIYKTDELIYSTLKGGKRSRPPKYYDRCLEQLDEDLYSYVKQKRIEVSENLKRNLLLVSHLSYQEILERREAATLSRTRALKRVL